MSIGARSLNYLAVTWKERGRRWSLDSMVNIRRATFRLAIYLLILMVAPFTPASADFEQAIAAAKAGDHQVAEREFRQLAELSDPAGQNGLGVLYTRGHGVPQNFSLAVYWFRKAAAHGYRAAQNNLGEMYASGNGVSSNVHRARYWFKKAADQNYRDAQTNLGLVYLEGSGVELNVNEAIRWFGKAAAQGHAEAQANIGHLYRTGDGVPRSYVNAYAWYGIAAASGYPMGSQLRDTVAAYLEPGQLERAQAIARALHQSFSVDDS